MYFNRIWCLLEVCKWDVRVVRCWCSQITSQNSFWTGQAKKSRLVSVLMGLTQRRHPNQILKIHSSFSFVSSLRPNCLTGHVCSNLIIQDTRKVGKQDRTSYVVHAICALKGLGDWNRRPSEEAWVHEATARVCVIPSHSFFVSTKCRILYTQVLPVDFYLTKHMIEELSEQFIL